MTSDPALQRIFQIAGNLVDSLALAAPYEHQPLRWGGRVPVLAKPSRDSLLCSSLMFSLPASIRSALLDRAMDAISRAQSLNISSFQTVLRDLSSLEEAGGVGDDLTVERLCQMFERVFRKQVEAVKAALSKEVHRWDERRSVSDKKLAGFGKVRSFQTTRTDQGCLACN